MVLTFRLTAEGLNPYKSIDILSPFKQKKELLNQVESALTNGSSKSEIYNRLLGDDKLYNKVLLDIVSFYVTEEKRERFLLANKILLFLLVLSFGLYFILLWQFFSVVNFNIISAILIVLFALIQLQLIYGVYNWNGRIFKSIITINVFWIIGFLLEFNKGYYISWLSIYPVILVIQIILSYGLYKKVFPDYNWKGPKRINNNLKFDI